MTKVYAKIAQEISRRKRGEEGNQHWMDLAEEALHHIEREILPSGSGFDSGSRIDLDESKPDKLVIRAEFHHMDDSGGYCGWSSHHVIVTPCLAHGFNMRVTGKDKRGIKEYIADVFHHCLDSEMPKEEQPK